MKLTKALSTGLLSCLLLSGLSVTILPQAAFASNANDQAGQ